MIWVCAASTEEKSAARAVRLEEAVDHGIAAAGRQVERQAFRSEGLAQLLQHIRAVCVAAVDLVDHDQAAQFALARELHEALGEAVDAAGSAHHDGDRLDRLQHASVLPRKSA